MIQVGYVRQMAAYNRWQNQNILQEALSLTSDALEGPHGAFFSSIRRTMSHILWADLIWLHRFSGSEKPDTSLAGSPEFVSDWQPLERSRPLVDEQLPAWANRLDQAWLAEEVKWFSGATNVIIRKPAWIAVTHVFNHQAHHRGQVHAMLKVSGCDTQPTDLVFMP